jgi:hypothetical protein
MVSTSIEPKTGVGADARLTNGTVAGEAPARGGWFASIARPMGGSRVVGAAMGGLISTVLWIGMFTVGLSVPSQPFRDGLMSLAGGEAPAGAYPVNGPLSAVYALVITAFCYTPTNLAMLCCLAALVGCLAYTATNGCGAFEGEETLLVSTDKPGAGAEAAKAAARAAETIPLRPTISAITWGFFIYLFMISGTLLAVQNPFAATSPDQYLRLAGTASLLAFVVGWRPELITRLVAQVGKSKIADGGESSSGGR